MLGRLSGVLGGVGAAALGLFRAEWDQLKGDLRSTGRSVVRLAVLVASLAFVLFWFLGLLLVLAILGLRELLPLWGATAAVLGGVLLIALILWLLIRRRLRELESPLATARRRAHDHVEYWRATLGQPPPADNERD